MNKLEIEIPNDKEIDWEASAQQKQIVLKDKPLTYEIVCQKLFENGFCYILPNGRIEDGGFNEKCYMEPTVALTKHQLKCIFAKNKLATVAVYLNNGWKPDLYGENGFCIVTDYRDRLVVDGCGVLCPYSLGKVVFKSEELAKQAMKILEEETIRLALEPLY